MVARADSGTTRASDPQRQTTNRPGASSAAREQEAPQLQELLVAAGARLGRFVERQRGQAFASPRGGGCEPVLRRRLSVRRV